MEKKSNTLVVILVIVIIGLVGFIVYDKAINKETKSEEPVNNQDVTNNSVEGDTETLNKLKEVFIKVHGVKRSPNAYCGKSENSDKIGRTGTNDYISTEYSSYEEMMNDLKQYATEEVLNLKSDNYYVEDGKFYCESFGKGGSIYEDDGYVIELNNIGDDTITATVMVEQSFFNNKNYKAVQKYEVKYTKNDSNWIISEYTQKYDTSLNKVEGN